MVQGLRMVLLLEAYSLRTSLVISFINIQFGGTSSKGFFILRMEESDNLRAYHSFHVVSTLQSKNLIQ